jgi:hypothetical protein
MAADKAFHIKLNGKGYILLDETYAMQPQRPFNPRFSTGDPSFGDLSFWQFFSQEDWSGGEGQEIFDDKTKYLESCGWDLFDGKPRLSYPYQDALMEVISDTLAQANHIASRMFPWRDTLLLIFKSDSANNDGNNANTPAGGGGYTPLG